MKYPQLVSTRAVNAISDWLVSRLEQLGVEAPLIYSRLLLSLLQSSVQINDPIEFSNLETFLANRKGNNKRYPPCDTDTLRKITAVQCLMEIVSSEQEITNIENLVDELCEKLIDIEKQSTSLEEDEDLQIAASALNITTPHSLSSLNTKNEELSSKTAAATTTKTEGSKINETKALSAVTKKANQQLASDVEDPRKRYYRAFPALSKEMEDSIVLLRRNTKSLTWPVDRKINSSSVKNITSNSSGAVIDTSSKLSTLPATTTGEKEANSTICVDGGSPSALLDSSQGGDRDIVLCNTAGVKRKSKRRRNQALSKGKTTAGNNIRKNSYCGGSSSPTWDTDFEGSWEMGRDLIKEFIVKQNNRNRSTSESAAYNMAIGGCSNNSVSGACETTSNEIHDKGNKKSIIRSDKTATNDSMAAAANAIKGKKQQQQQQKTKAIINKNNIELAEVLADPCVVEVSLCENIVENSKSDDMSDNMTEGSLSTARRLYERDISNDSLNEQNNLISQNHSSVHQNHHNDHNQQEQQMSSVSLSEQLDFAQFKAKFNSSVEALWKTTNSDESVVIFSNNNNNNNQSLLQSNIVTDSVVSVAPQRSEDLKNFWTNYYSHRYDVDKFKESDANVSSVVVGSAPQSDGQNNYFSMPIISSGGGGGGDDFDKSVGGKRAGGGKTSPIGVFLQSTIWSENSNASYPDTDESFFMKVLNSTSTNQKPQDQLKMDISGTETSFFYPYQASKWSEGINGVPNVTTTTVPHHFIQQQQQPLIVTSSSSSSSISAMDHSARSGYNNDFADSTPSSSSSYIGGNPNWHLPAGNNLQADIKSWNSSNPTSLTELYGGGGGGIAATSSLGKKNSCNFDRNAGVSSSSSPTSSNITLANHSTTTSGFMAYSRIKSYAKLIDAKPIAKWQKPEVDYHHHLTSTPPDDENLLTSERTHFHPIKMSYADGHTFEISSNLDVVDFERSDSGYLYLESEKYLEYTRSDTLAEEDSSVAGHYQQSLSSMSRDCTSSVTSTKSSQSEFLIRFRVRNTDQACQTDSNVIGSNAYRTPLSYQAAASSSHLAAASNASYNSAHETAEDDDEDEWMDIGCIGGAIGSITKDDEECVSMDQWSMVEITKKCVDNNNASHTLWGMCPACNSDIKSNPANRLLKAELNVEGDEIMSDLRYMQDLYIGSDWDEQNCTRDEDDDDTDLDAETIRDCEFYQPMATPAGCGDMEEEDHQQKEILYNVNKLIADLLRPENAQSFVNALGGVGVGCIGGGGCYGMTGDGGGGGAYVGSGDGGGVAVDGMNDEKYIGGLWNSDENIIWKKEFNPIDIFSRFNNNNNYSFLDKLNWEYSNLAEIWDKASPEKTVASIEVATTTTEELDDNDDNDDDDEGTTENQPTTTTINQTADENTEDEENIKITSKNIKNLLKSSSTNIGLPPNENSALFEINERRLSDSKRMQCFLNSNKFKISNRFDRKRRHSASQNVCSSSMNNNNTNFNNNNSIIYDNNNSKFSLASPDSSSSTFLLTTTPGTTTNNSNNNTITTTNTTSSSKATTKDTLTEYDRNIITRNDTDDNDNDQHYYSNDDEDDDDDQPNNHTSQQQATIITCKYWTTMQPIVNNDNNNTSNNNNSGVKIVEGETRDDCTSIDPQTPADSFFIDKNSQFIDGLPSITLNTSSILKHVTLVSRPLTR